MTRTRSRASQPAPQLAHEPPHEHPTDEERWQAVLSRDPNFTPRFVYAVLSTGIYCRPSCPSRRPARERVRFYGEPLEAERAGFRACRRCQPQGPERREARVEAICRYLAAHFEEPITLKGLARRFGGSPQHLQRSFKAATGLSPRQYRDHCRMEALRARLAAGEDVSGATFESGFGSSSRLYSRSDAALGMTPKTFQRRGRATKIVYTLSESPLGALLVAASARGVCAVSLGDDPTQLENDLRRRFAAATLERDDAGLREALAEVLEHLAGRRALPNLPRDVQATAFQAQVWAALSAIPYGETRSYGEVAASLGRPEASRAVAQACASNPTALLVPCHRVLRGDGGLGGYRWGVERKARLLALERRDP